jgi:hypothetical protein
VDVDFEWAISGTIPLDIDKILTVLSNNLSMEIHWRAIDDERRGQGEDNGGRQQWK